MTEPTAPLRLRDPRSEASTAMRELIDAGRSELPGAERLRGVAAGLAAAAPAAPGGAGSLVKSGGAWLGHAGLTKIGAALLIVGAGTGALAMRARARAGVSTVAMTPPRDPAVVVGEPTTEPAAEAVVTSAPSAPEPAAPAVREPVGRARLTLPATPASPVAVAVRADAGASGAVVASRSSAPPSTWGSAVALVPEAPAAGAVAPLSLVQEAQRLLGRDPSRALELALLDERASGGQSEDRDVVIIEALVRLGRLDEARARASSFVRVYPGSSHRAEIAAPFGFDPGAQGP